MLRRSLLALAPLALVLGSLACGSSPKDDGGGSLPAGSGGGGGASAAATSGAGGGSSATSGAGGDASADQLKPTTTKTKLLANNTSASSLFTDLYTPAARFNGSSTPISNGDAPPGATDAPSMTTGGVSKVSIHDAVGPTKVFVETQTWFCTAGSNPLASTLPNDQCGSHIDIGEMSNARAHVEAQVADMQSRGVDGVIMDWQGFADGAAIDTASKSSSAIANGAAYLFKDAAEKSNGAFQFAIVEDEGIKACAAKAGCDVTQALLGDIDYAAKNFFGSSAYLKVGGRPALFFFSVDAWVGDYGKTIDWDTVRANASGDPMLVFENSPGFTHAHSDGAYSWLTSGSDPSGHANDFVSAAKSHASEIAWGGAWKGFDDGLVNGWGGGRRYSPQECGKVWMDTLDIMKANASALDGVQIPTWDDYEEGSEVETGVDNHLAIAATMSGTKLSWTLDAASDAPSECATAIAAGYDIGRTVHHFAIYATSNGEDLELLADDVAASARSIDLAGKIPSGAKSILVYAVGQPMVHNHFSNAASLSGKTPPPSDACTGAPAILEPTDMESVGPAIHLRVSAPSCLTTLIAYIDDQQAVKVNASSIDQWVNVSMGKHTLEVNGWAGTATAHVSPKITFDRTY